MTFPPTDFSIRKGTTPTAEGNEKGGEKGIPYPEWDYREGRYRRNWCWVQEKPLRVSGALYTANNAVMLWASRDKYVANTGYSYIPRAITAVSYIFANAMLYLSNRGQTNDNKNDLSAKLADAAAQVIAAQPKEAQQALVHEIAGFMAAQPDIKRKAGDIVTLLTTKLAEIGADKTWQTAVAQAPAPIAR